MSSSTESHDATGERGSVVGGLSYATTDKQLEDLFAAYGTVESARVIMDKFSGRSKGFGFVEMSSGAEAQKAIQALNGTEFVRAQHHCQ